MDTLQHKKFKVLLIGDDCIDRYIYGTIDRISPEAPVPVLRYTSVEEKPGMAANVYQNLKSFEGIEVDFLKPDVQCIKERFIDQKSKYQMMRLDKDYQVSECTDFPDLNDYDCIVISDYNKGFVTHNTILQVRERFTGPIFMDTKKRQLGEYEGIFIKINEKEFKEASSLPSSKNLIVTLGERGCSYVDKIFPVTKTEVFDVTGAGDTFLAALAYEYLNTRSINESIEFANECASIGIKHRGCYILTKGNIEGVRTRLARS
jgi:D-beta-D-heptose 7-phosphate kinase/D-beta-D-heptose 1-phosphate adenosyltransferase